ncbi:RNA-directed DNA polymerase, eukaryota [Tanacetum coccineum]
MVKFSRRIFTLYGILKKKESNPKYSEVEESLKYPPGFTPDIDIDAQINSPKGVEVEDVIHDSNENSEGVSSGIKQNSGPNNTKVGSEKSVCSGHFKKDFVSKSGGSILQVMEELIKVGQIMGYNMEGCLAQKAKKDWVRELCDKHKVSFLSLQETKMENIDQFNIKLCWGNYGFDSSISPSVGNSGGILCVWDPRLFHKTNVTISDYLIIIQGVWIPSGKKTAIISIYAPQDIRDKKLLWEYLSLVISNWKGDVIVMGDFNEVRSPNERYGSVFNSQGANIFNQFISSAGLEELPLGGCKYTWCHKTGTKMSKLDRFLVSDGLWRCYPDMSSITLDRFLSDHRPILMRESHHDYGPTPFRFYHYWFDLEGFDKFVEETWMNAPQDDTNAMVKLTKKLRYLKQHIRTWIKDYKFKTRSAIQQIKDELSKIDVLIDKGEGNSDICSKRRDIFKSLQDIEKLHSSELSQKSKVKWAIGGDENSKYFHGVLNKNRNQHSIRGILVDGNWIETPSLVKKEFLSYFSNRFDRPPEFRLHNNAEFPNKLSPEQQSDLEINVTRNEIKKAIWDCGTDKSPGPDGFTFGFFRRYWSFLENDVIEAVNTFFINGNFPKGINSSFITLIPKNQEAKTTKDFRPITLIGCIYKIISKILANRMVFVLEDLVNEVQSAFISKRQILDGPFILNELYHWCSKKKKQTMIFKVDFEKAYDSVRWDYLDDILRKFGFGEKWCSWIRNCLISSKGSILVNGSPTMEFQFHKGLKQGDPLSPFLFILVMESLHISISRVVEAGLFRGVQVGNDTQVSHLFFADDAVFMGHWSDSNIDIIIRILDCFYHASGLKINMSKSKLLGISVHRENAAQAAQKIGCDIHQTPFSNLGSKVGDLMSRVQSWDEIINIIVARLSRWKMQTLSIEGRFTLIKSVLGSIPIYHMSLFRVPIQVLRKMESIRGRFFNGSSQNVIKGIHGIDGNIGRKVSNQHPSLWLDIIKEVNLLQNRGIDLMSFLQRRMGNGEETLFWDDKWRGDIILKTSFPRVYLLETQKNITVANKLSHSELSSSFRRLPRSGIEEAQYNLLTDFVQGVTLSDAKDCFRWSLEGSGEFTVSSTRKYIDDKTLDVVSSKTRWIKEVPIKVNILAWKVKINGLPTRLNLSKRGIDIESILCPICEQHVESVSHIFFTCHLSREIFRGISRWWQIDASDISCYEEWLHWLLNLRISSNHRKLLEGVCFVSWWYIWNFRNKYIFGPSRPMKAVILDEIIASSFLWCNHRSKFSFSWIDWIKNPHLMSL